MTDREQIDAFYADLTKLIARYCAEFELNTAAAIGVLAIKQHELTAHAMKDDDSDESERH